MGFIAAFLMAEKTAVLVHNCTVLLVMSWSNVTDALTANFNALWS